MTQIGLETWRGAVNPSHIDQMGHMNVRFYVSFGLEAMAGLAGALGMPRAFTTGATATWRVRELHIRYLKEARLSTGLHLQSAVLEMGESDARILQVLFHSATGEPAAAITSRVEHVTPQGQRPFPWPQSARRLAEGLTVTSPDYAMPRGLLGEPLLGTPTAEGADALGLVTTALGALNPSDCDVFGLMRTDHLLARISDAMPHLLNRAELLKAHAPELAGRLGGATVEFRARYYRWPSAGERVALRSGFTAMTGKTSRLAHWLTDPAGGAPWAEAEMITVNLDLQARKSVELPPALLEHFKARIIAPPA